MARSFAIKKIIDCSMCIACNREGVEVDCMHPVFVGGLCLQCKDKIKKSIIDYNNIGINYCAICGRINSQVIACRNCNLYYCRSCLSNLIGPEEFARTRAKNIGPCCTCARDNSRSIIRKRKDWKENLQKLRFYHLIKQLSEPDFGNVHRNKRPIRVLSLFDNLATGKFALEANKICVEKYYVAMFGLRGLKVIMYRPDVEVVQHLGDVCRLSEEQISKICPIDLLLGRLPRDEPADVLVNGYRENDRFETNSAVFYEYYRVLSYVDKMNKGHPLFWLLEAGTTMLPLLKNIVCRYLGSEPVQVQVSRGTPPTYLWGNLPGLHKPLPKKVHDVNGCNGTKRCFVALEKIDKFLPDLKTPRRKYDEASEAKDEKMFNAVVKIERCEENANHCEDLSGQVLKRALASLKGYFCTTK